MFKESLDSELQITRHFCSANRISLIARPVMAYKLTLGTWKSDHQESVMDYLIQMRSLKIKALYMVLTYVDLSEAQLDDIEEKISSQVQKGNRLLLRFVRKLRGKQGTLVALSIMGVDKKSVFRFDSRTILSVALEAISGYKEDEKSKLIEKLAIEITGQKKYLAMNRPTERISFAIQYLLRKKINDRDYGLGISRRAEELYKRDHYPRIEKEIIEKIRLWKKKDKNLTRSDVQYKLDLTRRQTAAYFRLAFGTNSK